ncbi:MAG: hemerythrin domain-containing protein [Asgard group archaeon]|nr:hemerythrin domain-containing protein [Asgard group archaeon]
MVLPIAPLMIEHRLIERMIDLMKKVLKSTEKTQKIDPKFIDMAVEFIRTYADRCHHGKEEDILFKELQKKKLDKKHEKVMNELIEEHIWARKTTSKLVEANNAYREGKISYINEIINLLRKLVEFYPNHIIKEDDHFFKPVMDYFSEDELAEILSNEYEFDRAFIHEYYKDRINALEQQYC